MVGIISLIAAGSFAVFEYFDRKTSMRAAETLRMIEVWELRGAQDSYLAMSAAILKEIEGVSASGMTEDDLATMRYNVVRRILDDTGSGGYDQVMQYFTRLSLCIQAELCSDDVAKTFFLDTLLSFRLWFSGVIFKNRYTSPSHAREIDWLICHMTNQEEAQSLMWHDVC